VQQTKKYNPKMGYMLPDRRLF